MKDKQIENLIKLETKRQKKVINLIASENIVSNDVLEATGSVFTNKYAEGYPGKRYYGGNEIVDQVETLCQQRALKLFKLNNKTWHVNVQPLSGSPANYIAYFALVPLGGKIMSLSLDNGGHLTHIQPMSNTGKLWKQVPYYLDKYTQRLNYAEIYKIAKKEKPKMIITGYSAYSRMIDFKQFKEIAHDVGALLLVDMSHVAGLIAGQQYMSPFPYADIVTTTTHKTLRGARGAMIFSKKKYSKAINNSVIPGMQGGPHINNIAGIAVALKEANTPQFKTYTKKVIANAKVFANVLAAEGWNIVSDGTDSHLFMIDFTRTGLTGNNVKDLLAKHNIIVNANMIPFDTRPSNDPSGIRIGTPTITTQGYTLQDTKKLALQVHNILLNELKRS